MYTYDTGDGSDDDTNDNKTNTTINTTGNNNTNNTTTNINNTDNMNNTTISSPQVSISRSNSTSIPHQPWFRPVILHIDSLFTAKAAVKQHIKEYVVYVCFFMYMDIFV